MPSIITAVDEMHREQRLLAEGPWVIIIWRHGGRRSGGGYIYVLVVCTDIYIYIYTYIGFIILKAWQNFNLILNLRVTIFHTIFLTITCMIAFSGGLSRQPLMAILQPQIWLVDSSICFSSSLIPVKGCWRVLSTTEWGIFTVVLPILICIQFSRNISWKLE